MIQSNLEVVYAIFVKSELKYIGRTNNFHRRTLEHRRSIANRKGSPRYVRAFQSLGKKWYWHDFEMNIVYDGSPEEVQKKEMELIVEHRPPGNTEFID
jgi:predicted GIY-YIG superfamily endonuclease